MPIESNAGNGQVDTKPDQPNNDMPPAQPAAASFGGTTFDGGAPTGSFDFMGLEDIIGLQRGDSTVEPYLTEVLKQINQRLPDVKYERLTKIQNSYAFRYDGPDGSANFFGLLFASPSDSVGANFVPASMRLRVLKEELQTKYKDLPFRLSDARVVISDYEPEMSRTFEMANTIVRTFNVSARPEAKNAKIDSLLGTEFVADWSVHEARKLERSLSPHGVPPRMDVGLTLKAKIQHNFGRDLKEFEVDYRPLGVIGGYTEIRNREPFTVNGVTRLLYRPVFNITVASAVIPLEGIFAILLAAIAPNIYNSKWWASQWLNLGDGMPQPGLLEEDQQNPGRPYNLKSREELVEFIDTYFATPEIVIQIQDGRDSIPGVIRIASNQPEQKSHFGQRLANFFGVQADDLANFPLSQIIETRADGVYGDPSGTLHDTRDIDYLYIAAKNGVQSMDQNTKAIMLGGSDQPKDRAQIVANMTGSFAPFYLNSLTAINADFVKWLIRMIDARRLTITDPNSMTEHRSFGSFLTGFGSSTGMGSIVGSGSRQGGLGMGSIWNNY